MGEHIIQDFKEYATRIELEKEVKRLDKKNKDQDGEIKQNRENIAKNDIQTGQLEAVLLRVEKSVDKLSNTIGRFGALVIGSLIFPVVVAAIVFVFFKG